MKSSSLLCLPPFSLVIRILPSSWLLNYSIGVNGLVCNDKPAKHKESKSGEEVLAGGGDDSGEDGQKDISQGQ